MNFAEGVVFIATLLNSVLIIYNVTGKPYKFLKKRKNKELQQKWKENFETYSNEVVETLKPQLREYIQDTVKECIAPLEKQLEEIKGLAHDHSVRLDAIDKKMRLIDNGCKDVLRQKMMTIYHKNEAKQEWTIYAKEAFDELYKDYTEDGGNSYITKYYERTRSWKIIADD